MCHKDEQHEREAEKEMLGGLQSSRHNKRQSIQDERTHRQCQDKHGSTSGVDAPVSGDFIFGGEVWLGTDLPWLKVGDVSVGLHQFQVSGAHFTDKILRLTSLMRRLTASIALAGLLSSMASANIFGTA